MRSTSLKLRLLLVSLLSITLALALAGAGLVFLFSRHVERRIDAELETYVNQIAGNVVLTPDGSSFAIKLLLPDPRFQRPLSGLYWRASDAKSGVVRRSRSLWDSDLDFPDDVIDRHQVHRHLLPDPAGGTLIALEQEIAFPTDSGPHLIRIAVGLNRSALIEARNQFAADLVPSLLLLGLVLLAAVWAQITLGLRPLQSIRAGIAAIRGDKSTRLSGTFPEEVMPLVHEVNTLLDEQGKAMDHARARAADLAHGLKTPLTVLRGHAQRLEDEGQADEGRELAQLAADMQRHVDHQLALTRLQSRDRGRPGTAPLCETLNAIVRTVQKTPQGEALAWQVTCPAGLIVPLERNDLTEMLGNIVENATKWAASRVSVGVESGSDGIRLTVSDDGPGFPDAAHNRLGERGKRFDESAPGSGLGLAIVRDIAANYGVELHFDNGPEGGARITLTFPSAGEST
ncbi:MAG: sensor histidine kinase [Hyphomicrobiales bacterium]|nr:MAG: sensor histidine kinase [Hyphomicrobiales bacterium]